MKSKLLCSMLFSLINIYAFAQLPSFEWRLENEKLTSPTTYQLDVYLYNTGATDFELRGGTIGINTDSNWRNGGIITITHLSSELNSAQQTSAAIYAVGERGDYWRKIITNVPTSFGTKIPSYKRVKCFTLVLYNTMPFSTTIAPKFAWRFNNPPAAGFNFTNPTTGFTEAVVSYSGLSAVLANQKYCYTPSYWEGTQWITKTQLTGADTAATLDKFHEATVYNGTYSGSLDTRGYVLMPTATHFMASTDVLTTRANLDNYGTLNSNTANIEFKGNDIAGTDRRQYTANSFTTNNLTQKNPYGVVIGGNTTVSNQLNFSTGNIIVNSNNLIIDNSASIVGYNDMAYVVTDTIGCLKINNIGPTGRTNAITFPVGNTNGYNPATITNTGTTDDFSVAVAPIVMDANGVITSRVVQKTWYINDAQSGGSILDVQLQWNATDELQSFNRAVCYISKNSIVNNWQAINIGPASGNNIYTKTLNSYSDLANNYLFGVGSNGILGNNNTTGVKEAKIMGELLLYPNPNNGEFIIKLKANKSSNARISLSNLLGQELWTESQSIKTGEQELHINTKLNTGIYMLRLQTDNEQVVKGVIVR